VPSVGHFKDTQKKEKESDNGMKTKMMATLAILLLVLSVAGFVYAHWSDMVTINGTVYMGSLSFGFGRIVSEWDSEDYGWYWNDFPPPEKWSGEGICTLKEPKTDAHTLKTVYDVLEFNITGGYGYYWAINKFTINNSGTIPLNIQNISVTIPAGFILEESSDPYLKGILWFVKNATGTVLYEIWLYEETEDVDYVRSYFNDPMMPPWWLYDYIDLTTINGTQIDPCHDICAEICVFIYQEAEECHTYTFSIDIEGIQWNKWTP